MNTTNSKNAALIWKKLTQYLSQRAHSETELIQKLRTFDKEEVHKAIKRAKTNNWIEKPEDMALKIVQELNRKKKAWLFIRLTLKKKGLTLIPKNPKIEQEKILYWLSKKGIEKNFSKKQEQSLYRFLRYRGFESSDIREAFQQFRLMC